MATIVGTGIIQAGQVVKGAAGMAGELGHVHASLPRGLGYSLAAAAGFGLFFLCLKNAEQSGVLWPVAVSRTAGT